MDVDDWLKIQAIVLTEENRQIVTDVINKAKELYQESVGKGKHELIENEEPWNVSETINYNLTFVKRITKNQSFNPIMQRRKVTIIFRYLKKIAMLSIFSTW